MHGKIAALLLDDRPGHGQADTDLIGSGTFTLVETAKDMGEILRGDSATAVTDFDDGIERVLLIPDL